MSISCYTFNNVIYGKPVHVSNFTNLISHAFLKVLLCLQKYKTINTYYSTTFENVHLLYLFFRVTICKITSNGGQGFSHGNQPPRAVYSGIFKFTIIITLYYFIKDSFKMYLTATSFLSLCHFKLWKFPRVSCLLYTMHIATLFAFNEQTDFAEPNKPKKGNRNRNSQGFDQFI